MTMGSTAERFIAAFSAADFDAMRELLAPDLVAWVTGADGEMARLEGERIAEWWMVDAKPAESDVFWAS
jgi:ketosteroid isomerase-like protein